MRFVFALTTLSLALMGCNGGEDFSDATVGGCPAGAPCDTSVRGEILVELVGPKVDNIGYKCVGSEVVYYTSSSEETTTDTDGETKVIPPFTALCPASSNEIEFFLGNGVFEGNKISLGSFLFPQQLQKETFQITLADLIVAPTRNSIDESVLYRSALIQALDNDGDAENAVNIQDKTQDEMNQGEGVDVNDVIDDNPDLIPSQPFDGYANYTDFMDAWQPMINAVNGALNVESKSLVEGFDEDTLAYEERISQAADRTRAGLYSFESATECLFIEDCDFTAADDSKFAFGMTALVLPTGKVLAGGQLVRSVDSVQAENDFVGLAQSSSISETLQFQNTDTQELYVGLLGAGIGAGTSNTSANLQGRLFVQTLYSGTGSQAVSSTDYELDYPSASYSLKDNEKGELSGELLGRQVPRPDDGDPSTPDGNPMPLRGTKTGSVQVELDPATLALAVGNYRVSLQRACVGESDDDDAGVCETIPNQEYEIGSNYPESISRGTTTIEVDRERVRQDENGNFDFCLTVDAEGLVTTGDDGQCGSAYQVGMVTRTFPDTQRAVVFIRLSPGLDPAVRAKTPHYNTEIQGMIDLAATCSPMYQPSDTAFDNQIRPRWVEGVFLPAINKESWVDKDAGTDLEKLVFASLQSGAVDFARDGCVP